MATPHPTGIDATIESFQKLKACRTGAMSSMDLKELKMLIEKARAACVAAGEIEDAEEKLAEVSQRRKDTHAVLVAALAPTCLLYTSPSPRDAHES
eukprot:1057315-Prymnesium_polylepis.1